MRRFRGWRRAGLLAGVVLLLAGCRSEWVTGPEYQIAKRVRAVADAPLVGPETRLAVRLLDVTIEMESGRRAMVYTRGEVDGTFRGVETSCLCLERVPFARGPDGWEPEGFVLPRMAAVVEALEAREAALEAGDAALWLEQVHEDYEEDGLGKAGLARRAEDVVRGAEGARHEVVRRVMRIERTKAVVTETWRLDPGDGSPPVEGRARYRLKPEDGRWRFVSGLM